MRKSLLLSVSTLAFVVSLGAAVPAFSFELFGLQIFGSDASEDAAALIADPRTYKVTVDTDVSGDLDGVIKNASRLLSEEGEPASGVAGLIAKARGDYTRITAALYNEGHYGGTISILIDGKEANGLAPDTNLNEPAQIAVRVNAGPEFRFNELRIINRPNPTTDDSDFVELPENYGFLSGEVAKSSLITKATQSVSEAWKQQGYPKADVTDRKVVANHANNTVDVTLTVQPGAHARFGEVSVAGTESMNPEFVKRQSGLDQGQEFDPDDILKARTRLSRLEVFRSMRFEQAEAIRADGTLPYTITVQENKLRRFGGGASFATLDGLGVEGYWMHRNLFGQAERLRLDAKIAGISYPIESEAFDYAFGGTFTKPGFLTPDTDLTIALGFERNVQTYYTKTAGNGRVGLSHIFSDQLTVEGGMQFEYAHYEVPPFGSATFKTLGAYAGATYDNRDSTLDPTKGWYLNGTIKPLYELSYGNTFVQATAEARGYVAFDQEGKYVLAGRVKAGAVVGPDLTQIPSDLLFYAGGGGSVRGYGYRSIGVDNGFGSVTGGRYLVEASAEARVNLGNGFGGVAFVDGGYVAADTFPSFDKLQLGAGLGLRYYTPIGPLRLDVAVPLNKRDGDPDYALYVGIGQAF